MCRGSDTASLEANWRQLTSRRQAKTVRYSPASRPGCFTFSQQLLRKDSVHNRVVMCCHVVASLVPSIFAARTCAIRSHVLP
jgi:hypothetical protein